MDIKKLFYVYLKIQINLLLISNLQGYSLCSTDNKFVHSSQNKILVVAQAIIDYCFQEKQVRTLVISDMIQDNNKIINSLFATYVPINQFVYYENNIFTQHKRFRNVYKLNETHFTKKNLPASNIIITISSTDKNHFSHLLKDIRDSIWWNHEAIFLIVNKNIESGCVAATTFLKIIWSFKILSVVYICQTMSDLVYLFTFNPFTKFAPEIWKKIILSNQQWTLFQHLIQEINPLNSFVQDNLYFDKAKYLSGYNIKVGCIRSSLAGFKDLYNKKKAGCKKHKLSVDRAMCTVLRQLNSSYITKIYSHTFVDPYGAPHGLVKDIFSDALDFSLSGFFLRDYWKYLLYPVFNDKLKVLSIQQPVNYFQRLIITFYPNVCLILLASFCISALILKCTFNISAFIVALESIQLFTNQPSLQNAKYLSQKIMFIFLQFFLLIITTYMLCCLSAINTIPGVSSIIDSVDDLINSKYDIFGEISHKELISNEVILSRFQKFSDLQTCTKRLLKYKNLTCISAEKDIMFYVQENSMLHLSQESLLERSTSYLQLEDSPLLYKLNLIFSYLKQGGIIQNIENDDTYFLLRKEKVITEIFNTEKLLPGFYILCGCSILGFCTFLLELIIHNKIWKRVKYLY